MAAVTKRAIHREVAGLGHEGGENFRDHDGPMRPCRRFAGREDFGDRVGMVLRVEFLVFVLEAARVFARVAHAALVRCRGVGMGKGGFRHGGGACTNSASAARKFRNPGPFV